jgi:hypothetical protein
MATVVAGTCSVSTPSAPVASPRRRGNSRTVQAAPGSGRPDHKKRTVTGMVGTVATKRLTEPMVTGSHFLGRAFGTKRTSPGARMCMLLRWARRRSFSGASHTDVASNPIRVASPRRCSPFRTTYGSITILKIPAPDDERPSSRSGFEIFEMTAARRRSKAPVQAAAQRQRSSVGGCAAPSAVQAFTHARHRFVPKMPATQPSSTIRLVAQSWRAQTGSSRRLSDLSE